jgi:hypothetical protein
MPGSVKKITEPPTLMKSGSTFGGFLGKNAGGAEISAWL